MKLNIFPVFRLLNNVFDPKLIRTQDVVSVLNNIAANSDGIQILWDFYRDNYQKLIGILTTTQLGNVINNICGYFSDDTRKLEVFSKTCLKFEFSFNKFLTSLSLGSKLFQ
jgi:hypothetical protein